MPDTFVLVCTSGPQKGVRKVITEQGLRIGRDAVNEFKLEDNGVSRQHARFLLHGGQVWLQDMGSRNGVYINDRRVQNQEQVNLKDRVQIGSTNFEVRIESLEPAPAPVAQIVAPVQLQEAFAAPPAPNPVPARKGLRLLPFLIAALIVALIIAAIAMLGGSGHAAKEKAKEADPVVDLLKMTAEDPAAKGTVPGKPATPADAGGLASLLSDPGQGKASEEKWPDPPAGASSAELVEKGHQLYRANRLHDALVSYHQALTLDSSCEICKRRIDRLNTEIEQAIRQQFDAGLKYYTSLQYEQAITAWDTVLLLSPNPESQAYKQAKEYMEKAQANMKRQY